MPSKRDIAIAFASAGHKIFPTLWVEKIGGKPQCACVTRPPLRAKDFDKDGCKSPGKHPLIKGNWREWADTASVDDVAKIWTKWPEANPARAVPKGEIVIDIDEGPKKDGSGSKSGMENFKDFLDGRRISWAKTAQTGNGGTHVFRKLPQGVEGKRPRGLVDVDYKIVGGYTLLPGSNHMSGHDYEWDGALADMKPADVAEALTQLPVAESFLFEESRSKLTSGDLQVEESADLTQEDFLEIVDRLPNGDMHYDDYMNVLFAISSATKHSESGRQAAHAWAARSGKYDRDYTDAKWDSIHDGDGRKKKTYKFLLQLAKENGIELPQRPTSDYDKAVVELSEDYATVVIGEDERVIDTTPDANGVRRFRRFLKYKAFVALLVGKVPTFEVPHPLASDPDAVKVMSLAEIFLKSPFRRQYRDVVFKANPKDARADEFNLWPGFATAPSTHENPEAHCSLFLDHLFDNVANGVREHFEWILAYFAQMVQQPWHKLGTAIVFRGDHGVGKTFVGEQIGKMIGDDLTYIASRPEDLVGNFNSALSRSLLTLAEEAVYAGDKDHSAPLKHLITTPRLRFEPKGVDALMLDSVIRVIMTSNSGWVVPAALAERRFAVFDVGDAHRGDRKYFAAIVAQLEDGGYEALMQYLMSFDWKRYDPGAVPMTEALRDQKLRSLSVPQHFVQWALAQQDAPDEDTRMATWFPDGIDKPGHTSAYDLKKAYAIFRETEELGRVGRWIERVTAHEIYKLLPCKESTIRMKNGHVRVRKLPPLAECVEFFDGLFGGK